MEEEAATAAAAITPLSLSLRPFSPIKIPRNHHHQHQPGIDSGNSILGEPSINPTCSCAGFFYMYMMKEEGEGYVGTKCLVVVVIILCR